MIRRPRRSTLFPSTPLFRSDDLQVRPGGAHALGRRAERRPQPADLLRPAPGKQTERGTPGLEAEQAAGLVARRSEEHTSELQSQSNLVCRPLPEKKSDTETA